jgi:hypothetical protein
MRSADCAMRSAGYPGGAVRSADDAMRTALETSISGLIYLAFAYFYFFNRGLISLEY